MSVDTLTADTPSAPPLSEGPPGDEARPAAAPDPAAFAPLLDWDRLPDFAAAAAAPVAPALREALARASAALDALEAAAPTAPAALLQALAELDEHLDRPVGLVRLLMGVQDRPELRAAWSEVQGELSRHHTRLGQSRPLYDALRAALATPGLDPVTARVLGQAEGAMRRSGVGLDGPARARFEALSERLSRLSTQFSEQLLDARKAWSLLLTEPAQVAGLGPTWRALAAAGARAHGHPDASADAGPWRVTLDYPVLMPVLSDAEDRSLREAARRASGRLAAEPPHDNGPVLREILELRHELAQLVGFPDYASLSIDAKMAGSVDEVVERMEALAAAGAPAARAELARLEARARAAGAPTPLMPWDLGFWGEREREERVGLREDELRPWFPLPRVLDGVFALIERLFGVRVTPCDAPAWHPDAFARELRDADGALRATLFFDLYSRPADKRGGAWMTPFVQRRRRGDAVRAPVAVVCCNQAPPVDGRPSLMSPDEVSTLLHELGHALHHCLTEVDEPAAAGIAGVEWDAVEVPSMFFESFAQDGEGLRAMSGHVDTGEPLPEDLLARLQAARTLDAGQQIMAQADFSLADLAVHRGRHDDPEALAWAISARLRPVPPLPEDRRLRSFSHLFSGGYAAGYYSYRWAELIALDAYAAFAEVRGDADAEAALGRRWRATVLAQGGSRHPLELFQAFRGRDPEPRHLLAWYGLPAA
jgi:oligopeptidase A